MSEKKRKTAFVLMPFKQPYNSYYLEILKPSLRKCGYSVSRSDDLFTPGVVMTDIQNSIRNSDLILCEMSDRNPNVFYELGLAHAIGKPAILISNNEEDIPFDLRHIRVIFYDCNIDGWENKLRNDIAEAACSITESSEIWPPIMLEKLQNSDLTFLGSKSDTHDISEELFLRLQKRLDIIGLSLHSFFVSDFAHPRELVEKIVTGCQARILILNPESTLLSWRAIDEGAPEEMHIHNYNRTLEKLKEFEKLIKNEKREIKGAIKICIYESIPHYSYYRCDDEAIVGTYFRDQDCREGLAFNVNKNAPVFEDFLKDFERIYSSKRTKQVFILRAGSSRISEVSWFSPPTIGFSIRI